MNILDARYTAALRDIYTETALAKGRFPKDFNTKHEAYAVLLEEVDELWYDIRHDDESGSDIHNAIQVAAIALRYVAEFGNHSKITPGIERSGAAQFIESTLKAI